MTEACECWEPNTKAQVSFKSIEHLCSLQLSSLTRQVTSQKSNPSISQLIQVIKLVEVTWNMQSVKPSL